MKRITYVTLFMLLLSCTKIKTRDIASIQDQVDSSNGVTSKECQNDICVGDNVLAIEPLRVVGKDFYKEAEVISIDSDQNFTLKFFDDEKIVSGIFQEDISYQKGCLKPQICVEQTVYVFDESFENPQQVIVSSITSSKRSVTVFNPSRPNEIFYVPLRNVFTKEEFVHLSQTKKFSSGDLTKSNE